MLHKNDFQKLKCKTTAIDSLVTLISVNEAQENVKITF